MKKLSRKDLELIGERVFRGYNKLPTVQIEKLNKLNPTLLAEELLGLTVDYTHLSKDGLTLGVTSFGDLGIQVYDDDFGEEYYYLDGKTILIEKNLTLPVAVVGRRNFTIMHEVSHHILRMLFPKEYGSQRSHFRMLQTSDKFDWGEWQADVLTSSVLMPKDYIDRARFIFQMEDYIPILHSLTNNSNYQKFCTIADYLGVSKQALAIRMKRLGYIGEAYIGINRHKLIELYKDKDEVLRYGNNEDYCEMPEMQ